MYFFLELLISLYMHAPMRNRPLLSPPNVPHLVITVDTCVMVEQRKISKFFLDEVLYFDQRKARYVITSQPSFKMVPHVVI